MSREETAFALRPRVDTVLRGSDPDATREHLRVGLALAAAVAIGAAIAKVVVVSPVVWEAIFLLSILALVGITVANAYWQGGLLAGYTLVAAPVASGLLVAHVDVIVQSASIQAAFRSVGFGILVVAVVTLVLGTVGYVLGTALRWARNRSGFRP